MALFLSCQGWQFFFFRFTFKAIVSYLTQVVRPYKLTKSKRPYEAPLQKKLRFEEEVEVKASLETSQPKPVSEDVASASASVSHPGVDASSATALSSQPNRSAGPRNALTYSVGESIVKDMKAWYAERVDDENVAKTWKHLHNVLFKKVRVPYKADIWCQAEEGTPMVVSEEFVASQVKKVIERREQWLRNMPTFGNNHE